MMRLARTMAGGLALCAGIAAAADYPSRPLRLIVPASPGSGMDFFARTVGQSLSEAYKQQVIADNRAGAGGLIGAATGATATPARFTRRAVGSPYRCAVGRSTTPMNP